MSAVISKNIQVMLDPDSNIIRIRVRWNSKKNEVKISTGIKWDTTKWDFSKDQPKPNTIVKGITANYVQGIISEKINQINDLFKEYEKKGCVPSSAEIRNRIDANDGKQVVGKTFSDLCSEFVDVYGLKKQWTDKVAYAYLRVVKNFESCNKSVTPETVSEKHMANLLKDYLSKGRQNRYIRKEFTTLKTFLNYVDQNVTSLDKKVINFDPELKVIKKTVTYLTLDELNKFYGYQFPENGNRYNRVKDMFCFMCNTSLRYSDMQNLKWQDIDGGHISIVIEKTAERVTIPLSDMAKDILSKYNTGRKEDFVFPRITDQKLNVYLREAAKIVGLDREFVEHGISGTSRTAESKKLHEIISCHCARRTFVVTGLSIGLPPNTIMKCTGHQDYESMKPYISISDKATEKAMEQWNKALSFNQETNLSKEKEEAINLIIGLPDDKIQAALAMLKGLSL